MAKPPLTLVTRKHPRPSVAQLLERRLEAVFTASRATRVANIWMTHGQIQLAHAAGWLTEAQAQCFEQSLTVIEERFAVAIADPATLEASECPRTSQRYREAVALGSELTENLHLLLGTCIALVHAGEITVTSTRACQLLDNIERIVRRVSFAANDAEAPGQGGPRDE
ncbi:hypothetical protein [Halotalea alkalilenta]|uniref:Uncharacterized protein n=1 Tax=Halotalea alkalilenta TaxID=376489 RepID=A0A172YAU4_9GAMM|nr:hypothetical protein [Halotalea alkalilenta]ANF56347.1 hypothetical protein A5892_01790 [Halotalea alkalilenta]